MSSRPARAFAAIATLVAVVTVSSISIVAPAAAAPPALESAQGMQRDLLAGPPGPHSFVPPLVVPAPFGIESATIVVNYTGFTTEARNAFQFAVDLWEQLIVSPVTIEIDAEFTPLDPGVLGSAGPDSIFRSAAPSCLPETDTWYPGALANALCGTDLDGFSGPGNSEAGAQFNSDFSVGDGWYFGLDGNPAGDQYDFVTVVMHELGHALGFIGSMTVVGATGSWGISGSPLVYDTFAESALGQSLLAAPFGNPSPQLKTQLTGGDGGGPGSAGVFFDGTSTSVANGGPARLYAPNPWAEGSSFSHLDESTFNNTANAMMTPVLAGGEAIDSPGPVVLAMFEDMGWELPNKPEAPTNVQAFEGSNAAKVTFDAPDDGESAITRYTVTASPGGAVSRGASSPVYVAGLENGTDYTFTVEAENAFGLGPPSTPSTDATPELHGYHPVDPERILDTRFGTSTKCPTCQAIVGARAPQSTTTVQVTGTNGGAGPVPDDGSADAVVMNVTATGATKAGWLTVWDTGTTPTASNLNFAAGQSVPNLVTVKLDGAGRVRLGNTIGCSCAGTVHAIFDVVGYYSNDGLGVPVQSEVPTRILDTRPNDALAPNETRPVPVAGVGPVPPGATAVAVNVTAVSPTQAGWLTIYPSDAAQVPTVSNLNFVSGQTVPNLVVVKLGGDGEVRVNNTGACSCAGSVHVIVDVFAWFGPAANGGGLNAVTPSRILDTRKGVPSANLRNTPLAPQETATIDVAELGTVPTTGAGAVVINVTVTSPTANGWLTVWSSGGIPQVSNLNFVAGQTVPNLAVVALGPGGTIKIGNTVGGSAAGFTHVIVDVVGWYAPDPP